MNDKQPEERKPAFGAHLGAWLEERTEELTHRWVNTLAEQLDGEEPEDILPSDDLLNHIPEILDRVAACLADPGESMIEALLVDDLYRLAELRRRQGFGIQELLREYQILGDLIQAEAVQAAEEYSGPLDATEVVDAMGKLYRALHLMDQLTARSFRAFEQRYQQEKSDLLQAYGEMLSHELGNRLGAAETAMRLIRSGMKLDDEQRDRLEQLVLEGIQRGLETVKDVRTLADPVELTEAEGTILLPLLTKEAVRQSKVPASRSEVSLELEGEVPTVRVPGAPVRLILSNLVGNALKYHRTDGPDRWVRVRTELDDDDDLVLSVEDNGPGIPAEERARVFEHHYRGEVRSEGSGLGLSIVEEAVQKLGGEIRVEEGSEGGALFTARIPVPDGSRPSEEDEDAGEDADAEEGGEGDAAEDGTGADRTKGPARTAEAGEDAHPEAGAAGGAD